MTKGLNEATELRTSEHADNEDRVADITAGLDGLKAAQGVLKEFYENALLQTTSHYVPPNSDAEGHTVKDLAPDTFQEGYHGNQDAAKGIFAQLAVIQSDFQRTLAQTQTDESDAESEFQTFKTEAEDEIAEKEKLAGEKRREVKVLQNDNDDANDDLKEHYALKAEALEALAKLKPQCVSDHEKEALARKEHREQELSSLRNAYKLLG